RGEECGGWKRASSARTGRRWAPRQAPSQTIRHERACSTAPTCAVSSERETGQDLQSNNMKLKLGLQSPP
ncbi:hypothetical protein ACJX0J_009516, partial [Zea mays]